MTAARGYQRPGTARAFDELPLVGQLLAWAATGAPLGRANRRFAWRPHGSDARQFEWVLAGGLGPLLHLATRDCADVVPPAWREALLSADLTARIRHGNRTDTMLEILDACDRLQLPATLLKGMSVGEQLYPAEHLRPMADIDVLIPAHAYAKVEAALLDRGFARLDHPVVDVHHHGPPLCHPRLGTIVELHRALFPDDSPFLGGTVFGAASVTAQSIDSHYRGRPVKRLGAELQLAYIASSWFNDLTHRKVHPSFIASMLDAIYLLAAFAPSMNWSALLERLDDDMAKASLHAMGTYLPRFGVEPLPPAVRSRLADTQAMVGPIQRKAIHLMLDRYLIGGRPWNLPLPPPVPGRYSWPYQLRKLPTRLRGGV